MLADLKAVQKKRKAEETKVGHSNFRCNLKLSKSFLKINFNLILSESYYQQFIVISSRKNKISLLF